MVEAMDRSTKLFTGAGAWTATVVGAVASTGYAVMKGNIADAVRRFGFPDFAGTIEKHPMVDPAVGSVCVMILLALLLFGVLSWIGERRKLPATGADELQSIKTELAQLHRLQNLNRLPPQKAAPRRLSDQQKAALAAAVQKIGHPVTTYNVFVNYAQSDDDSGRFAQRLTDAFFAVGIPNSIGIGTTIEEDDRGIVLVGSDEDLSVELRSEYANIFRAMGIETMVRVDNRRQTPPWLMVLVTPA